jgi:hypothetical protein
MRPAVWRGDIPLQAALTAALASLIERRTTPNMLDDGTL